MSHKLLILAILTLMVPSVALADDQIALAKKVEDALPPHVGACVMTIVDGRVVFEQGYGLADVETNAKCTPATNFRMASCSKQFTATAIMLLADRGKLSLDDTLDKFFPGFPEYGRKITVKHVLTHTSGLPAYEDLIPAGTTLQLDDADVLRMILDSKEPRFAPGEKWEYSNSGYVLLGLIAEIAAEKPFHEFMLSDVLKPLGMNDSVLYQRGFNTVSNRAYGHEQKDGSWVRADQSVTSATRGDGAIYTSLKDYQKWLAGIEEQKLLKPESYKAMFTPQAVTDRFGGKYGYGWFIDTYRDEPRIYHNGDTQGFNLCVQRFPKRKAAIFIQLNNKFVDPATQMNKVGEKVADLLVFNRDD